MDSGTHCGKRLVKHTGAKQGVGALCHQHSVTRRARLWSCAVLIQRLPVRLEPSQQPPVLQHLQLWRVGLAPALCWLSHEVRPHEALHALLPGCGLRHCSTRQGTIWKWRPKLGTITNKRIFISCAHSSKSSPHCKKNQGKFPTVNHVKNKGVARPFEVAFVSNL